MDIKNFIRLFLSICFTAFLFGCVTAKPNHPYQGPYPEGFNKISDRNPLLAEEIGKLPELQDGISDKENIALLQLVRLYKMYPLRFDDVFDEMYKIGLPGFRKYCTPLQALFWLAEDGLLVSEKDLITLYTLEKLLGKAWKTDPLENRILSDEEIKEIIDGTVSEDFKQTYLDNLQNNRTIDIFQHELVADYRRSKRWIKPIFSKDASKIIEEKLLKPKKLPRWDDYNQIIDRLNAPELLDYYINQNISYKLTLLSHHKSHKYVINDRHGDCDDLAFLGRTVLSKAGYDTFGRFLNRGHWPNHVGLGVKLDNGLYLLAVHFNRSGNHMRGPYKTILELDQALGYGLYFSTRESFNFNW